MQMCVAVTQSQRWQATEQKKSELEHYDGQPLSFPALGMKNLSHTEKSQTELGSAPIVQVGCKAKCRLQTEGGLRPARAFILCRF